MAFLAASFIQVVAHTDEPIESDEVSGADAADQRHASVPALSALVKPPGHVPNLDLKVANEVSFRDDVQVETVPAGNPGMHGCMQSSASKDR